MKWMIPFVLSASAVWASECPVGPDRTEALLDVIEEARAADSEQAGRAASDKMWQIWLIAPDEAAQEVLDRGMRMREQYDFLGAVAEFDTLVAYCPSYAEGYNQRAFARFLRGEYDLALTDLDEALKLSPYHVGAQSGRALTLMHLGRLKEARAQMLDALANNPWLGERSLVAKGAPLGPVGEDI